MSKTRNIKTLLAEANADRNRGRIREARENIENALSMARESGDATMLAETLRSLGRIERDLNHTGRSAELYREAAGISRAAGDRSGLAHALRHLGEIERERGELERSATYYEEALAIYREDEHTHLLSIANTLRGQALLEETRNNLEDALQKWTNARKIYQKVNVQEGVEECNNRIRRLE